MNAPKMKKWFFRSLAAMGLLVVALPLMVLGPVDSQPYQEEAFYDLMLERIDTISPLPLGREEPPLLMGWARESLVPGQAWPMAGYGDRQGKPLAGVRDSVGVRAFVMEKGAVRAALVCADLLILPPEVSDQLRQRLPEIGWSFSQVYLTATHTHASLGAFAPGWTGEQFGGPYDPEAVTFITDAILAAIATAGKDLLPTVVGFAQQDMPSYTYNRLMGEFGRVDPWLRWMQFRRADSTQAVLATFSAHATCLPAGNMQLSGDYPGILTHELEADPRVDFAAFAAGAVGSHGPGFQHLDPEAQMDTLGKGLAHTILVNLDDVRMGAPSNLGILHLPLALRAPQFKVSENWRLRPWVFKQLVGESVPELQALRLGPVTWIGTPCDFSGELVQDLWPFSHPIIITSFNGGYIGYITDDRWYPVEHYETRTMNWFGPNGKYFTEIISRLISRWISS